MTRNRKRATKPLQRSQRQVRTPHHGATLTDVTVVHYDWSKVAIGAEGQETPRLDAEQLKELTNAKLRELAEDMGIDCSKLRTKAQLIAAICDEPLEDCIVEADEPPVLEAGVPVV